MIVRYFGIVDFDLIGRLTYADYDIIVKALEEQMEDKNKNQHYGAYLNALAGEHNSDGTPRFPTFKHFYNHDSQPSDPFAKLKEYYRSKHNE